jgi:DNA-binding NtrC family response regulator
MMTTVLLLGPTGTGKELAATLIHHHSPRRQGPLIAVNCAALPDSLAESELFGHERGAFTNATDRRSGQFELAAGGTIFLDEIGELSLSIQAKLLRVLEQREFRRVGGVETLPLDVRVVAATNRDLEDEVAAGRFRRDLFYRLNVFPIHLPSLSDRPEDIPLLTRFFVEQLSRKLDPAADPPAVTEAAMAHLQAYTWPGNVRELRNVVERCLVLAGAGAIAVEHLPDPIRHAGAVVAITQASRLAQQEASMVLKALEDSNWNKAEAARQLGISWDNLRYRIKKYSLAPPTPPA